MADDRLKLELPTLEREADALDFLREFENEDEHPYGTNRLYTITQDSGTFRSYEEWVKNCKKDSEACRHRFNLPTETYFLIRKSDDRIVGMIDIRFMLDQGYWNWGGNIGYSIRKSERGNGYGKVGLYLALKACHEYKLEVVLLSCEKNNLRSSYTIRALDGKLVREYCVDGVGICQFFAIDVAESIKNHHEYENKIY